jgi:hypothetical protein
VPNVWIVSTGTLTGNTATIVGTTDFGACTTSTRLVFDGAGNLAATDISATQTTLGQSIGYNCWPAGSGNTYNLSKVF